LKFFKKIASGEFAQLELCENREGSEGFLACAHILVKLVVFKLCSREPWCSVEKFKGSTSKFFYKNTGKDESTLLIFRSSTKAFPL